jgi:tetratricopeptide (TPR) repeat protein
MKIFGRLFGQKESSTTPEPKVTWQLPDSSNEEDFVRRCLEAEFKEEQETRTFRSDPAFANVLTPLNSQQYVQTIKAGHAILPRFPDFDLVYKWIGSAYRSTQQLPKSRDILSEGLRKAKRKCLLLTDMGETEWQLGNINEALYWWSQALHCLSSNPIDYNAYLLLSYVAKGVGLSDFEQKLLAHVDSLRGGQVRMDPAMAGRLTTLIQNKKTQAMQKTLRGLQSKYFSAP